MKKLILALCAIFIAGVAFADDSQTQVKWLVTWTVTNSWMIPCDHGPTSGYDEYGRYWESHTTTLEICWDSETLQKEKYFDSYKEAKAFVKTGKTETWSMLGGQLQDWKITKVTEQNIEQMEVK